MTALALWAISGITECFHGQQDCKLCWRASLKYQTGELLKRMSSIFWLSFFSVSQVSMVTAEALTISSSWKQCWFSHLMLTALTKSAIYNLLEAITPTWKCNIESACSLRLRKDLYSIHRELTVIVNRSVLVDTILIWPLLFKDSRLL